MSAPDASERVRLGRKRPSPRNGSTAVAERIAAELAGGAADEVARRLRVLGHPARLGLVAELAAGPRSVAELAAAVGLEPAGASKHLRELQRASVAVRRQDGTHAIYALADATALKVVLLVVLAVHADAARMAAALRVAS
jgi:DNA-binding transcriptional ArsR family regulator